jgi:hypothetical protein
MGGYVPRREIALVGEKGPELVALPGGSYVYPAHQTRALMSATPTALTAAAAAVTYKVNVIMQAGTIGAPFDVARAVDDAMRRAARLLPRQP